MSYSFDEIMAYHPDNTTVYMEIKKYLPKLIPFVGAGLTQFAYYSWSNALRKLSEKLSDSKNKKKVNKLINGGNYLDAAQLLEDLRTPTNLARDIATLFSSDKLELNREKLSQEPISLLPYLFPEFVLTTNFDETLETVYRESNTPFSSVLLPGHLELLKQFIRQGGHGLLKLHGTVTGELIEYEKIIFTQSQYDEHYGKGRPLPNELKIFFASRMMLFLGCSLENDRTMDILQKVIQPGDYYYTIISCNKSERDEKVNRLGGKQIRAILYENGRHEAVRVILEHLLEETNPDSYQSYLSCASFQEKHIGEKKDLKQFKELLNCLTKRIEVILCNSEGYHLEKITTQLYPNLKGLLHETSFQAKSVDTNTSLRNCLNKDWDCSVRSHYMLVGDGGCGKTVAMQQTAQILLKNSIPAIYIPMHDLKPERKCIEEYIQHYTLFRNSTLWEHLYQTCYEGAAGGQPSLVLFLDGWNEVREEKIEQYWFTDILREEIEQMWMSLPGVQVVLAGRERADKDIGWNGLLSYLEVMPLQTSQIESYLQTCGLELPDETDSIWQTISNPLMLVLYVNTAGQKNQFRNIPGIQFISGSKHSSQAAVIWNFLQCQVGKFSCLQPRYLYNYFVAINYAASWIGWNMEQRQRYTLKRSELIELLDKAGESYPTWWSKGSFLTNMRQRLSAMDWQWDTEQICQILCKETLLLHCSTSEEDLNAMGDEIIQFIHQKFRDCYAAIYMRSQLAPYGAEEIPEDCHSWQAYAATPEVLDLLDTFFQPGQLKELWLNQQGIQANNNSFTMFHLLELYQRAGVDISQLDFSKQDLRFVSLQNRGLNRNGICFRRATVSRRTLLPQNHPSTLSFLAWLPAAENKANDLFLTAGRDLRLWNARTGELLEQWESHDSGITCISTSSDGLKFATTSHDKKLLIYRTSQLEAPPKCYTAKEELSAVSFSPIGSFLAVGDKTGKVFLCSDSGDYLKDVPIHAEISKKPIKTLRFDCRGQYLSALIGNNLLVLWEVAQNLELQFLGYKEAPGKVLDLNFDSCGTMLFCATEDGAVFRLKTDTLSFDLQWRLGSSSWQAAVFSSDNSKLAIYEKNGVLKLINASNGIVYKMPSFSQEFNDDSQGLLAFSMDGRRILCGLEDSSLFIWNAGQPMTEKEYKEPPFCTIKNTNYGLGSFIPLSDHVFLCAFGKGYLTWWDIDNQQCFRCEKLLDRSISDLVLSPDKKLLVTADRDHTLHIWEMETLCKYHTIELTNSIRDIVFSPDGAMLCCACDDFHVYGWDTKRFDPLFTIPLEKEIRILSLVFLPDHSLLGGATNGMIYRWNVLEGVTLKWPQVHNDFVSQLALSTDGKFLVSVSHDGSIFYWELENSCCHCIQLESGTSFWNCVAISSDGHNVLGGKLVINGDNELHLWKIRPYKGNIKIDQKYIPLPSMVALKAAFFSLDSKISYTTGEGMLCIRDLGSLDIEHSMQLIPNISLINADFRGAYFEDQDLLEQVRMSGGRTENAHLH